jgi:hypothetical protein
VGLLGFCLGYGAVLFLGGCGGLKLVPVSGTVYVDGQPAARGSVIYKPDKSRGNESGYEPLGVINPDGTYKLITQNRTGAPPGAYKVVVFYFKPVKSSKEEVSSLIPAKYNDANATPLAVEVVEHPAAGAYDLKVQTK